MPVCADLDVGIQQIRNSKKFVTLNLNPGLINYQLRVILTRELSNYFLLLAAHTTQRAQKQSKNRVKRNFHANVSLGKLGVGIKRGTGMAEWRNGIAGRNGGTDR